MDIYIHILSSTIYIPETLCMYNVCRALYVKRRGQFSIECKVYIYSSYIHTGIHIFLFSYKQSAMPLLCLGEMSGDRGEETPALLRLYDHAVYRKGKIAGRKSSSVIARSSTIYQGHTVYYD